MSGIFAARLNCTWYSTLHRKVQGFLCAAVVSRASCPRESRASRPRLMPRTGHALHGFWTTNEHQKHEFLTQISLISLICLATESTEFTEKFTRIEYRVSWFPAILIPTSRYPDHPIYAFFHTFFHFSSPFFAKNHNFWHRSIRLCSGQVSRIYPMRWWFCSLRDKLSHRVNAEKTKKY
jgi:hypothetical protein